RIPARWRRIPAGTGPATHCERWSRWSFDDTLPEVFSLCSSLHSTLLINQQTRGMSISCRRFFAHRIGVSKFVRLQHTIATFVVANPNRFVDAREKNLPV